MEATMKFEVMRRHLGDKIYEPGDTRDASENEVAHLVKAGILRKAAEKAEPAAPKNKAETRAPRNKAE
jgi:hypothetical protein